MSEPRVNFVTEISYDTDKGEMVTETNMDGSPIVHRDVVAVRARLEDKMLTQAVIFELERNGYTVIAPEGVERWPRSA